MPIRRSKQYILEWCTVLLLLFACMVTGRAQNLTNEKIQVAADALTVLKFNSEITHCELGMRDGFTCLVRDNDNTVVIKTLEPIPASTNLAITEGRRTHYFVLVFLKKVDINNTKLFYDYSDLKALKKLVKKREEGNEEPMALVTPTEEKPAPKSKKEEAAEQKMKEAEQKKIDEELAKEQEQERQKALAAAEADKKQLAEEKARKAKEEKEAAALAKSKAAEEKKLAAAAKEKEKADAKAKAEEEKKVASAKTTATQVPTPEPATPAPSATTPAATEPPKKLSRRDERILRKEKEQEEALAQAQAEEKRKQEEAELAAKEKARVDELQHQEMVAAEKERQKQEELQKQRDAVAAKAAEKEEANRKKMELAAAKAAEKAAAQQKQKDLEAARAPMQAMAALRKRYPNINFADIPEGQMITGEYFVPVDTLENYEQSVKALNEEPCLGMRSEPVEGIDMRLEDIKFSGVNAYLRVHIRNNSKKEYLVGRMLLRWNKEDGGGYNLFACYVTGFPVIPPGGETTIVYVARGVNAKDNDTMFFRMSDRIHDGLTVEVPFSGKIYNDEMTRK